MLTRKLLRKCKKDQVPTWVIVVAEQCVEGTTMSRDTLLLNPFLLDYTKYQDKGMDFHYSWLLILISFKAWVVPEDVWFLGLKEKPCVA
jgi:hypothetical protein